MLSPGTILGTYEITSHIGSGGMGEVYQAHDTKLGRDVAIKVLPEQFARDSERLARFQREARMLAALNHPNIAAIYGLEESGGLHYLVMELVPGQTLRERTAGERPLLVEEALAIARQIAEALEAAHEKNIIHRDLKPANVKVTPASRVKVLDFGLAKAFAPDPATDDPSNSPTLSALPTQQGLIMGTAAYMSPEQARGRTVTKSTDIWAFGCVLYELLTGRAAFRGEDVTEILAAVVMKEPDWSRLPEATPPTMHTLLRHCLRKDRRQRLQDATDVRIQIEDALIAPGADARTAAAAKAMRALRRRWLVFGLSFGALVASITGLAAWYLKPAPASASLPVSRFSIALPEGDRLGAAAPATALSPDGKQLAYVAIRGGTQMIYLRAMDSLESTAVPGTEGGTCPFFSPDGQWLGFYATGELKKVSVNGGAVVTLGAAQTPRGATWSRQGAIIFANTSFGTLLQVSDAGGMPQPLTRHEGGETSHRWPQLLPDGNSVLFAAGQATANFANGARIVLQSLATGARRDLVQAATYPRYAPSGHLIYVQAGNLMAVPFDLQRLQITGTAVPVVESVSQIPGAGIAQYSISTTGSLVYVTGGIQQTQSSLVWVSRNGAEQPLLAPPRDYRVPRLSPDGRRITVVIDDQETQVWLYDISRDALSRFTFEGNSNLHQLWTPDNKWIAFQSNKEGPQNLFWQLADGSGGLERLTTSESVHIPASFSPDGKLLALHESSATVPGDIWVLQISDRKLLPFLRTPFTEWAPMFSPDGRWLAYVSNESGRNEVYVQPYPGPGGKWPISTGGGIEPRWNPNGRELFYRNGDTMMAVDITTQPAFSASNPRLLFEGQYPRNPGAIANYDISPDGQRFLMVKEIPQAASDAQINVVLNWSEDLKRLAPAPMQ